MWTCWHGWPWLHAVWPLLQRPRMAGRSSLELPVHVPACHLSDISAQGLCAHARARCKVLEHRCISVCSCHAGAVPYWLAVQLECDLRLAWTVRRATARPSPMWSWQPVWAACLVCWSCTGTRLQGSSGIGATTLRTLHCDGQGISCQMGA